MSAFSPADTLHRLVKQALDSGAATSVADAEALFRGYCVGFAISEEDVNDPSHQAALLTGVALARRVFLGGVTVAGLLDCPLRVQIASAETLQKAVERLGGRGVREIAETVPTIFIGGTTRKREQGFRLRAVFSGWRGGVVPAHAEFQRSEQFTMALSPMLAASLAVSEAFFHVQGKTPIAGKRSVGFSLWRPGKIDWFDLDADAPPLRYLPSSLWLIGLGHLGQAYLWALGLLPYLDPRDVRLILQDIDIITPSSESTSILSDVTLVGCMKTRAMATWAESRGFTTALYERPFDDAFTRTENDPAVALCGLDNALGRRALDKVGFPLVIEAGIGRGHHDFRAIRLHTLPGSRSADEIWKPTAAKDDLADRPAYRKLLSDGELDKCGVTLLAGKAVGAPFVGAVAACLAISEVLRLLHGGMLHQLIDLDLQSCEQRTLVRQTQPFDTFNPGYVNAMPP
jgi:hypothetical protein